MVSIVRRGASAHVGTVTTTDINPAAVADVVRARHRDAARSAPPADDAFADHRQRHARGLGRCTGNDRGGRIRRHRRCATPPRFRRPDKRYGFAHHIVDTIWLATSTGVRRRFHPTTGSVQINAKRGDASAWSGISTPWFDDVPVDSMLADLSTRLNWSAHTAELPAGRYETLLPPSAVADLMLSLSWGDGRTRRAGRTHRDVGARWRNSGGRETHRSGPDTQFRPDRTRSGM